VPACGGFVSQLRMARRGFKGAEDTGVIGRYSQAIREASAHESMVEGLAVTIAGSLSALVTGAAANAGEITVIASGGPLSEAALEVLNRKGMDYPSAGFRVSAALDRPRARTAFARLAPEIASGDSPAAALHSRRGAAERVRSLIPGALSILKGAVPDRARGLGHMAPTYFRREPGIAAPTAQVAPHCFRWQMTSNFPSN
jgi:hypothetical protein